MMGVDPGLHIIPFRGEYYTIKKEREHLVKHLIYPVPDPAFPFLGVHFTHNMKGYVEAGPNAVLAMRREGYRKRDFSIGDSWETFTFGGFWKMTARDWKTGFYEVNRSLRKSVFVKDLQKMIPEIQKSDLGTGGSGVRAQAVDNQGNLLDDFRIAQTEDAVHVLNAPSPGATSSLVIGNRVADMAEETFALV
jgi:L-2-hydroxyglutarate oxidase